MWELILDLGWDLGRVFMSLWLGPDLGPAPQVSPRWGFPHPKFCHAHLWFPPPMWYKQIRALDRH